MGHANNLQKPVINNLSPESVIHMSDIRKEFPVWITKEKLDCYF